MPIGEQPRRCLIRRTVAGDHVGRNRPGATAEAEKRHGWRQFCFDEPNRFVDRCQYRVVDCAAEGRHRGGIVERFEPRTFARFEANAATERVRDDQDVGEQNRRVETEPADRLQRNLGGELRRKTQIEHTADIFADRHVLRQIASRLAHHPDWRHSLSLAIQYFE